MKSNIFFHKEIDFKLKSVNSLKKWIVNAITEEKQNFECINFVFCTDEDLLEKNKTYLNHNSLTDIITFDYSEENIINGDIFISIERVKENAFTFAVPFENELNRVMIHGILHLLGYKDKSEEEQKEMTEKENYYLSKLYN